MRIHSRPYLWCISFVLRKLSALSSRVSVINNSEGFSAAFFQSSGCWECTGLTLFDVPLGEGVEIYVDPLPRAHIAPNTLHRISIFITSVTETFIFSVFLFVVKLDCLNRFLSNAPNSDLRTETLLIYISITVVLLGDTIKF